MDEPFELPVTYKGEEFSYPAQFQQFGYTHRFTVTVDGQEIFFEPDEEKNYRAVIHPDKLQKQISIELLKAIADGIEKVVK